MPPPSIKHSSSSSDLFLANHRAAYSPTTAVKHRSVYSTPSRSSASTASSSSSKSSYWFAWSNANLLGTVVSHNNKTPDSDLTEMYLEAHNRRQDQAQAQAQNEAYGRCSPYYRGLTDSTRIINREKLHDHVSPDRETRTTTTFSYASPLVIFKRQEWSSCFSGHSKSISTATATDVVAAGNNAIEEKLEGSDSPPITKPLACSPPAVVILPAAAAESLAGSVNSNLNVSESTSCELKKLETRNVNEEKPLRERVSSPSPSPPRNATVDFCTKKDTVTTTVTQAIVGKDEFVWAAKYRPKSLSDFICNQDQAARMQTLVKKLDCNHFIFEGPTGVGKRTMIWAMLRLAFSLDKLEIKEECKTFDLKGESIGRIKVRTRVSSHHIEVNLSDLKGYEKQVIVELIKETHNKMSNQSAHSKVDSCQAIILYDADKLSTEALLYIKWLLERYKGFSKFFFCCYDSSKLQPITGVCTLVQLLPPSKNQIVEVLQLIAKQEGITLPPKLAEKIADKSKNNLRQAIRSFEASFNKSYPFTDDQVIWTGWEDDIANIAKKMIEEQSPKQLYTIQGKIQNLIDYDVSPDFIFKSLFGELKKRLDEQFHPQLESHYRFYNSNSGNMLDNDYKLHPSHCRREEAGKRLHDPARMKTRNLLRIEEFMARFMSFYKTSVTSNKITQQGE